MSIEEFDNIIPVNPPINPKYCLLLFIEYIFFSKHRQWNEKMSAWIDL